MTEAMGGGVSGSAPPEVAEPQSVGETLVRAREALGLSLAEVAQQLKFAPRQIAALEEESFERLPSGTFARGMVRGYARLVKLDPEPLVERIAARVATPDNAAAVAASRPPIPFADGHRRANYAYAGVSLAILGAIAAVAFEWREERSRLVAPAVVPAAEAPREPPGAALAPQLAVLEPEPAAAPATAESQAPPPQARRRIVLSFERESWVEVRGREGAILLSKLNPAGSERALEGEPPLQLVIGNAQHVRLSVDERRVDLAPHQRDGVARFTLQ